MNRALLTAVFATMLLPAAAIAQPSRTSIRQPHQAITGRVVVQRVRCFGCPNTVIIEDAAGKRTFVEGFGYKTDIEAYEGKIVTVRGPVKNGRMEEPVGFRPGKLTDFVTGEVVDITPVSTTARFAPQVAIKTIDGRLLPVMESDLASKLIQVKGATVTLVGTEGRLRCDPNTRCIGGGSFFTPTAGANIFLQGRAEKLAHGMNGQTHRLEVGNEGTKILVSTTRKLAEGPSLWLGGVFTKERISGVLMFKATSASKGIKPIPAIEPISPWMRAGVDDGSNVVRDSSTTGGSTVGSAAAGSSGAGTAR